MNILDYLKDKFQITKSPVIYKEDLNLHKANLTPKVIKTISGIASITMLIGSATGCSPAIQQEQPNTLPPDNPSINAPLYPNGDSTHEDTRPQIVENIESTLAQRFGVSDLELQNIITQSENGSVVHKNLNGQNVVFINFIVDANNNTHVLTLPVDLDSYLGYARRINPSSTAINLSKMDLLTMSENKTSAINSMVNEACQPSQQMGQ